MQPLIQPALLDVHAARQLALGHSLALQFGPDCLRNLTVGSLPALGARARLSGGGDGMGRLALGRRLGQRAL
jgi:hypothetical protein